MTAGVSPGRVVVIGAGVAGLATALTLAQAGWSVEVLDDGAPSASSAAAGMLAPASEAVLDEASPELADALVSARERWDVWSRRFGLAIASAGAIHRAPAEVLDGREAVARRLGLLWQRQGAERLLLAQDAAVDVAAALDILAGAARSLGVRFRRARATAARSVLEVGASPGAPPDAVVVAAGWGAHALHPAARELSALRPIKGQLLRMLVPAAPGPTLRAQDVYLTPQASGWSVGASMEHGRSDVRIDADVAADLRRRAASLRPELAEAPFRAEAGVRAETPDGLPLVGRAASGVWLATGLRRNGWLLAPLVAEGIAAYLAGSDPGAALAGQARAWDPARVLAQGWA